MLFKTPLIVSAAVIVFSPLVAGWPGFHQARQDNGTTTTTTTTSDTTSSPTTTPQNTTTPTTTPTPTTTTTPGGGGSSVSPDQIGTPVPVPPRPNINGTIGGVLLCEAVDWSNCSYTILALNTCYDLNQVWGSRISGVGPDNGTVLLTYDQNNCTGNSTGWLHPGNANLMASGWNDKIISLQAIAEQRQQ